MIKGKSAVITGSTSGIGLAIARALAAEGADIMLNGLGDPAEIEEIRAALARDCGVLVRYHSADMTRPDEISAMMRAAEEAFGPTDILVNNAGIQHVSAIDEFPPEKWDAIIAINLSSAFHTIRAALPGMRSQGWGRIINISSAHGLVASPLKSAYTAAKHGIIGLTRTVALEGGPHGVTANAICPGYVLTELVKTQIPDLARARGISEEAVVSDVMLAPQPTKRFVKVEEIGAMAVFLCSAGGASINGAAQQVDGGWTAH